MIELPWPPRELSPNARLHHMAKARVTSAARDQAYWLTRAHGPQFIIADGPVTVDITFHPPDKRRRDLDGMFSSCKAYLDGMADAMCVNDHRFEFHIRRAAPVKGGKVVVKITDYPEVKCA